MNQLQNQSLLSGRNDNGSAKTSSYNALGGSQGYDEERTTEEESPSVGFTDGFSTWSDSLQAFHQAIFHVILYIGIGVVFYSFILDTKLTVIDSVYFSVAIFTTVGYGDISADSTNAGMIFTIFFALYGIIILGIFLGILGNIAVERQERLNEEVKKRTSDAYLNSLSQGRPQPDHDQEQIEESIEDTDYSFLSELYKIGKEQRMNIVVLTAFAIPVIILEKWSIVKGIYWLVITSTTIGLGDEYPEHEWSKFVCIFYVPLAVAFGGAFLGNIATSYVDKRNDAMEAQFLNRALNESALEKMDTNDDNTVTKDEFLVYMLKTLAKVEQSDIDKILELFDKLDKDNSGSLTRDDIQFIPNQTAKFHYKSTRNLTSKRPY
jgi:potassium channel subfamily K